MNDMTPVKTKSADVPLRDDLESRKPSHTERMLMRSWLDSTPSDRRFVSPEMNWRYNMSTIRCLWHDLNAAHDRIREMEQADQSDAAAMRATIRSLREKVATLEARLKRMENDGIVSPVKPIEPAAMPLHRILQVVDIVGSHTRTRVTDIIGTSRHRKIARARMIAIWIADRYADASLNTLGAAFQRDHSTILHAIRRVDNDPDMREQAMHIARLYHIPLSNGEKG